MKRRDFLVALGGAAAMRPRAARAQQPAMPVIGSLGSSSPEAYAGRLRAFRQGLSETGYVEGQNVAIEYRWANGQNDRVPGLAADLVRRRVSLIVVLGSAPSLLAAKAATTSIPIVFRVAIDPVAAGIVSSLNRPGGNLTGVTTLGVELGPKQLALLHELVPTATVVALLVNPTNPTSAVPQSRDLPAAAQALGVRLEVLHASTDREINTAFATLVQSPAGGLVIGADGFFTSRSELFAALAVRHAVPTISPYREFTEAGGLISYGGSIAASSQKVGVYAGRILKGERPADLPVEQSTKVELIINLKTAKTLGLTVPLTLQASADEVIE